MILDNEQQRGMILTALHTVPIQGLDSAVAVIALAEAVRSAAVASPPTTERAALMPRRAGAPHGDGQLQEQVAPSVGNGQRQVS